MYGDSERVRAKGEKISNYIIFNPQRDVRRVLLCNFV